MTDKYPLVTHLKDVKKDHSVTETPKTIGVAAMNFVSVGLVLLADKDPHSKTFVEALNQDTDHSITQGEFVVLTHTVDTNEWVITAKTDTLAFEAATQ